MAADGEGKSRNHNNDEEIKESVHTGPGFQSAASLLRSHGGAGTGEISLLSPRFRSAAAMAGWDEEALLAASLVVEDTPVRELKGKKRADRLKSPPTTNSQRKRRSRRQNTPPIPPVTLSLDEEDTTGDGTSVARVSSEGKRDTGATSTTLEKVKDRGGGSDPTVNATAVSAAIPCLDRLREELSCAICLDICFEPSTTPCGHSFCKKCLKCAATKCGRRCPKCRELISNARSCTVNTVLWNTIQLLFPMEVEARKKAAMLPGTSKGFAPDCSPENGSSNSGNGKREMNRTRSTARVATRMMERDRAMMRRMAAPTQSEDAALALRLQREEFMEVFRETQQPQSGTVYLARASLRAMASRAIQQHSRRRS